MRCKYCHNPDTWAKACGSMDAPKEGENWQRAKDVLEKAKRYKAYWKKNGSITVSGVEALYRLGFSTGIIYVSIKKSVCPHLP